MKKWIVEFRYVVGLSAEISTIEVEGYSDVDAKRKAEKIISSKYKTFHILRAVEADKLQKEQSSGALNREKPHSYMSDLDPETKRVVRKVRQHNEEINKKQEEINKIKAQPVKTSIIVAVITTIVFALSWLPFAFFISSYNDLKEAGFSEEELTAIKNLSNVCMIIPFVLLAIGIVITLSVFIIFNKKKKERLPFALKELESIKAKSIDL